MKSKTKGFLLLGVLPLAVMVIVYAVCVIAYAESLEPASAAREVWPWTASVCITGHDQSGRGDVFYSRTAEGLILRTPRVGKSEWIGGGQ